MRNGTGIASACPGWASARRISLAFLLLMLATGLESATTTLDSGNTESRRQEWKELDQRWGSLIGQRDNPDNAKWAALEDDVRSFARKYDLHLEEHATRANPDKKKTASDFAQCSPRDDVRSYRCNLFPGPKGVCRYVCVPLDMQLRADKK